jgi:hypothetical protein
MKTITKIILILVIFFIASILTTIVKEINIPYLIIIPPLVGFYIIYMIIKK